MKLAKQAYRNRDYQRFLSVERAFNSRLKCWTESKRAWQCIIDLYYRGRQVGVAWRSVKYDCQNPPTARIKYDAASPCDFFYDDSQWDQWIESLGPRLTN